jgi:hypothetical protein
MIVAINKELDTILTRVTTRYNYTTLDILDSLVGETPAEDQLFLGVFHAGSTNYL